MGFKDEVLADGPRFYHQFNNDLTNLGAANEGTLTTNGVVYVAGRYGQAVNVTDTNGYINFSLPEDVYAGEWTIEAWFKINETKEYNNICRISATDGSNHVGLRVRGSIHASQYRPNTIELFTYDDNAVWGDVTTPSTVNVNDGNWHYVVVQAKGTGPLRNLRMNVDGTWYTNGSYPYTNKITGLVGQTQKIAAGPDAGGVEAWRNGGIDELAIYNYALSDARVSAHYNAVESVPAGPPLALSAGLANTLRFNGLLGPTIALNTVVVPPKSLSGGWLSRMSLRSMNNTLIISAAPEPEPDPDTILGQWYFEVVMDNKSMNAKNPTASLETVNDRKNVRTELKSLVRA